MTIQKLRNAALIAAAAACTLNFTIVPAASAGEGHWSVGKGVQCRVINGKVVCTKNRP